MAITEILRIGGRQWSLQKQSESNQCRLLAQLRDRTAARNWLQQFKRDPQAMKGLRGLLAREKDNPVRLDRATDDNVLDMAARMFELGRWHAHAPNGTYYGGTQSSPGEGGAGKDNAEAESAQPAQARLSPLRGDAASAAASQQLTWIEIQLVDQDGKPVPNADYEIKLPDGSVKTGKLNAKGLARHEQIPAGPCQVRFTGVHATEWEPG